MMLAGIDSVAQCINCLGQCFVDGDGESAIGWRTSGGDGQTADRAREDQQPQRETVHTHREGLQGERQGGCHNIHTDLLHNATVFS